MNMNRLNNRTKTKRNMVKSLATFCLGLLAFGFASCDDELDVMQAYPFTVETMPVPKVLKQGETAEIRCELVCEGEFDGAVYTIRYFQYDGEGTLKLDNGLVLQPNDRYLLENGKFRLYMLVIDEDEARVVRMMFDLCISSGYGRWRLANFLNDHGIKNRKGQNWHDASVGGILHNPLYKGILRSGETYAGPFEALQIIAPDQFDLAQKLMLERTNERKERRTVPLNTAGQSLLSGNIFCGHCGGRLVLTTNGTTTRLADGTPVHKKRIRYVCYNKTRRRQECTGQTGYTMHILDGIVTEVLHQVFVKMQGASNDMIVGSAVQKQMAMIRSELQRARAENTKANKEYESLKAEVLKAIQGKSALPQDVLTEMLEDTRQKVLSTSERITTLTAELNDGNSKIEEMKAEFNRIVSWSKIFDESPMEVKKMICGYIIKKVSVFRDYRVKIEFNINVEQFLNGIDSINECATYELPMAQ